MFVKKYFCYQKFVVFEIFLIERTMFRQVIENLSIFTNIDFFPIELIDKKKVPKRRLSEDVPTYLFVYFS